MEILLYWGLCGLILLVLLVWGVVSIGAGVGEREYDEEVSVPPFNPHDHYDQADRSAYIKARMKADQLYSEWLATIPDQMSNEAFDKARGHALGSIAIITGLPLAHVKDIFK